MFPQNKSIKEKLELDILPLGGFRHSLKSQLNTPGLGPVLSHFPGRCFPVGAVHEVLSTDEEQRAAGLGFMCSLFSEVLQPGEVAGWIGPRQWVYPPALIQFGYAPDKMLFVEVSRHRDQLWALEEMLQCAAVKVVMAEVESVSFVQSRRLQLAVERSGTTCFLFRSPRQQPSLIATAATWRVRSRPGYIPEGLPGVGYPGWQVDLLKMRNGRPGSWELYCQAGRLIWSETPIEKPVFYLSKKAV